MYAGNDTDAQSSCMCSLTTFLQGFFCSDDGSEQPSEHMPLLRMERIRRAPIADSTYTYLALR